MLVRVKITIPISAVMQYFLLLENKLHVLGPLSYIVNERDYSDRVILNQCVLLVTICGAKTWTLTERLVHKFKVTQRAVNRDMLVVSCNT